MYIRFFIVFISLIFSHQLEAEVYRVGLIRNFSEVGVSVSNIYTKYFVRGVELAYDDYKSRLAAKQIGLEFDHFDYGTSNAKVLSATSKAIKSPVVALMGYNYSNQMLMAGPLLKKAGLLTVIGTPTADSIDEYEPAIKRICFNNAAQGKILAKQAFDRGARRAVLYEVRNCSYCTDLANSIESSFIQLGGKFLKREALFEEEISKTHSFDSLAGSKPDVVFVPNHEKPSALIIRQILERGFKSPLFVGGDSWGSLLKFFWAATGDQPFRGFMITHWNADVETKESKVFIKKYKKRYGQVPAQTAALSYDAAAYLFEVMLRAEKIDRNSLLQVAQNASNLSGVTGVIQFAENSVTANKSAVLVEMNNKKLKTKVISLKP